MPDLPHVVTPGGLGPVEMGVQSELEAPTGIRPGLAQAALIAGPTPWITRMRFRVTRPAAMLTALLDKLRSASVRDSRARPGGRANDD